MSELQDIEAEIEAVWAKAKADIAALWAKFHGKAVLQAEGAKVEAAADKVELAAGEALEKASGEPEAK